MLADFARSLSPPQRALRRGRNRVQEETPRAGQYSAAGDRDAVFGFRRGIIRFSFLEHINFLILLLDISVQSFYAT